MRRTLKIDAYDDGATVVVILTGELDLATVTGFAEVVRDVCRGSAELGVFDIGGLTFVDGTGLRAIFAAKSRLEEHSCRFALTEPTPQVARLFELTRATNVLPIVELERSRPAPAPRQLWPAPSPRWRPSFAGAADDPAAGGEAPSSPHEQESVGL